MNNWLDFDVFNMSFFCLTVLDDLFISSFFFSCFPFFCLISFIFSFYDLVVNTISFPSNCNIISIMVFNFFQPMPNCFCFV